MLIYMFSVALRAVGLFVHMYSLSLMWQWVCKTVCTQLRFSSGFSLTQLYQPAGTALLNIDTVLAHSHTRMAVL